MYSVKTDTDRVVLGSGELYAVVYDPDTDYSTLATSEMTCLGFIKENAELKTTIERKDIESANRGTIASIAGKKTVEFNTGIFSYDLENVASFLTGSEFKKVGSKTTFTFADNDKTPQVVLRFVAEDKDENTRITVDMFRCSWIGDFILDFNTEDPISFDYNFKVLTVLDENGKSKYFTVTEEPITPAA